MAFLHEALRAIFAALLDPLSRLGPLASLVAISAVSGLVLLFAFRWTSRPAAIRRAKQRIQANLLAVRIYRDDLAVVARAQGRTFLALAAYMGNMLVPFAAILLPFAIFFAHLDARYARRALRPGERALVVAVVDDGEETRDWILDGGSGVSVDSRPVRVPSRHEITWRVRADAVGGGELVVRNGERSAAKEVVVSDGTVGAASRRSRASLDSLLFAPTEPAIGATAGIRSIEVAYPPLDLTVGGWRLHWIVVFLAVSAVVAFALRKRAGVEF